MAKAKTEKGKGKDITGHEWFDMYKSQEDVNPNFAGLLNLKRMRVETATLLMQQVNQHYADKPSTT